MKSVLKWIVFLVSMVVIIAGLALLSGFVAWLLTCLLLTMGVWSMVEWGMKKMVALGWIEDDFESGMEIEINGRTVYNSFDKEKDNRDALERFERNYRE